MDRAKLAACALFCAAVVDQAAANAVHEQLAALTEDQRRGVLMRMMQREGEQCGAVTITFYQGRAKDGSAFWNLSCRPGVDWQVMFGGADGQDVKLLKCESVRLLRTRPCFQRFR